MSFLTLKLLKGKFKRKIGADVHSYLDTAAVIAIKQHIQVTSAWKEVISPWSFVIVVLQEVHDVFHRSTSKLHGMITSFFCVTKRFGASGNIGLILFKVHGN